jgi:hypothetical protein
LVAALLAVATAAVQRGPWRYEALPGAAPAIDDYRTAGTPWFTSRQGAVINRDAEAPGIEITSGPRIAYAARWVRPVPGAGYTRVTLDFALDDVVRNSRNMGAMIALVSFGRDGKRLTHWPRELFHGDGTLDWRRASLVVPWSDQVAVMRLELVNVGESGTLRVRNIEIAPLVDAPWYPWAHCGLIVAWSLLGLTAIALTLRYGRPRLAALAATGAALFIAVGGVLPEPLFDELASPVEQPLAAMGQLLAGPAPTATATPRPTNGRARETRTPAPTAAPAPAERATSADTPSSADEATSDEGGAAAAPPPDLLELSREAAMWARQAISHNAIHAAGFGGLALLTAFVAPPVGLAHLVGLAGFAATTEMLQMLTVTRDANLEDVAVDCLSALAGLAIGVLFRRLLPASRNSAAAGRSPAR